MWGLEQRIWFDRLDSEHDNLRAALTASLATDDPDTATRLAAPLEPFWETRGYIGEGLGHLRRVLAVETGVAKVSCAKPLFAASGLVPIMSPLTDERPLVEEAVTLFAEAGEQRRHIFSSHQEDSMRIHGHPFAARRLPSVVAQVPVERVGSTGQGVRRGHRVGTPHQVELVVQRCPGELARRVRFHHPVRERRLVLGLAYHPERRRCPPQGRLRSRRASTWFVNGGSFFGSPTIRNVVAPAARTRAVPRGSTWFVNGGSFFGSPIMRKVPAALEATGAAWRAASADCVGAAVTAVTAAIMSVRKVHLVSFVGPGLVRGGAGEGRRRRLRPGFGRFHAGKSREACRCPRATVTFGRRWTSGCSACWRWVRTARP